MNYKTALDVFETRYAVEASKKKVAMPKLERREVLYLMGIVQAELGNNHNLIEKTHTITGVEGQWRYAFATNDTDITNTLPASTGLIKQIQCYYGGVYTPVDKTETERINSQYLKLSDVPKYYAVEGSGDSRYLLFSATTISSDMTYIVKYYEKVYEFFETVDNENITWRDYDETDINTLGGSFKIPSDFHNLIIEGVLATLFPELLEYYLMRLNNKLSTYRFDAGRQLDYKLG